MIVILLELFSIFAAFIGSLSLSQATLGVGIIGLACLFAMFARIYQAKSYQTEIVNILDQVKYLSEISYKNTSALKNIEQYLGLTAINLGQEEPTKDVISPNSQTNVISKKVLCPECKSPMEIKVSTQGENKGRRYYVCINFPKCNGVLPIE